LIVVDTSTWVDHFRGRDTLLGDTPAQSVRRLLHPFVYGELLLGGLPERGGHREQLQKLKEAPVGEPSEIAAFIEWAELAGTGLGYVDVHLLVSTRMIDQARLLTQDKRLHEQAEILGIAFIP